MSLQNVIVGDRIAIRETNRYGTTVTIRAIVRVSMTQVIDDSGQRWTRDHGRARPYRMGMSPTVATVGDIEEMQRQKRVQSARMTLSEFASAWRKLSDGEMCLIADFIRSRGAA